MKSCGNAHLHCKKCAPEVGEKMRQIKMGVPRSAETRARVSAARDAYLRDEFSLPVVRLTESELRIMAAG